MALTASTGTRTRSVRQMPRMNKYKVTSPSHETDHRIANSLQFLTVMLRHESSTVNSAEAAREILAVAASRLAAMARVHRQLTQHALHEQVDLAEFLKPFCDNVSEGVGACVHLTAPGLIVPAGMACQIGIILNEFATNAVKHARREDLPSSVTVDVRRLITNQLHIVMRDNGSGLPDGFSLHNADGLGTMIIVSAVEKMGGTIRVIPDDGASFEIIAPLL
jgi:two-component sensor histidine kinase